MHAEPEGIKSRSDFWKWAAREVRDYPHGPNLERANPSGNIIVDFSEFPRGAGRCRSPLYASSSISGDLFDLWRIVFVRRMGRNSWEPVSPRDDDCCLRSFRGTAPRNIGRARRRWRQGRGPRAIRFRKISGERGPRALVNRAAPRFPSGDAMAWISCRGHSPATPPLVWPTRRWG